MLRLAPEPVPEPLWGRSAYRLLRKRDWERIRADVLDSAGRRCVVCGDLPEKGLTCHELWEHDDERHVATLVGFDSECRRCSLVRHIGFAGVAIGPQAVQDARDRLAEVNGITYEEVEQVIAEARRLWSLRSIVPWEQRVAAEVAERYPVLGELWPTT